jgi:hypothetical protein
MSYYINIIHSYNFTYTFIWALNCVPRHTRTTYINNEESGTTLRTTRRHIPEEDTLQNPRCENLKSYILIMFENSLLMRAFEHIREDVTGGLREPHNKDLNNLYSSTNIIIRIK